MTAHQFQHRHRRDFLITLLVVLGCLGTIAVSAAFLLQMFNETTQTL